MSKSRNANFLASCNEVLAAKERCIPEGLQVKEGEIVVPMASVLDHQTKYLLTEDRINKMLEISRQYDVKWTFWSNIGIDSSTAHAQYQTKDKLDHTSIMTTYLVPVAIQGTWKEGDKLKRVNVFLNEMSSCSYGQIYLRQAFEKETKGTKIRFLPILY